MGIDAREQRLEELESRVAWQEQTIDTLNTAIAEQAIAITRLEEKVRLMTERLRDHLSAGGASPESPGHEVPPHY
ncbi:MAG: SlyX family protein [Pseudomonadota bacterium]